MARRSVEIYIRGFNRADKAFNQLEASSTRAFRAVRAGAMIAGVALTAAAAAATALAVQGTRAFARYGQAIAGVSTMIRTNVEANTKALSIGVKQIAATIPQSTSILTRALYDLLSASVPVNQSLEMLRFSGKAAVAGMSDVQTAANLATGTINALGLAFTDTQRVFDLAFSTVAAGKVTFQELAFSLGQVLPSASKMNASIEEVYGSIAFLTKNAMRADMASISFARALDALGAKSAKLKDMGIQVFGTEGQYVGILRVIEQIAQRLEGMTEEAKVLDLQEMGFDIRAARAITIMTANLDAFRQTMSLVTDSAGAMGEAYDKMANTLINQWQILINNVKNLSINIGAEFAGAAESALKSMTQLVRDINMMIEGAGGLNEMWKIHGDLLLESFGAIAKGIVNIMVAAFKAVGRAAIAEAEFIAKDWAKSFFNSLTTIGNTIKASRKLFTEGFSGANAELQRLLKEQEDQMAAWREANKVQMIDVLGDVTQSVGQSMGELGRIFDEAGQKISDAALRYKFFSNEVKTLRDLLPFLAEFAGIEWLIPEVPTIVIPEPDVSGVVAANIKIKEAQTDLIQRVKELDIAAAQEAKDAIMALDMEYYQWRESLQGNAFEAEQDRIRSLSDRYERSTRNAMKLANILSNVQQRGWMRTLAALIRFATQQIAMYLEAQALEKLKQANDAQTAANWLRAHAAKMSALGAEATTMAMIATAQGNLASAAVFWEAVAMSAEATTAALAEMGAFEVQARALQVEGAALMKTAVVVKAAGEVAASGLEMAVDRADEAARKQEDLLRKEEDRLREEQRVHERILELQGRTGEMRMRELDEQIRRYEEAGVETALLQRLRALESAEVMREEGIAVGGGGVVIAPTIPTTAGGQVGPKNVIYQQITFNAMLDTAKEEDLRAWAEELAPYLDEIEDRSEA